MALSTSYRLALSCTLSSAKITVLKHHMALTRDLLIFLSNVKNSAIIIVFYAIWYLS